MPDFMLEPDELEPECPERHRLVREVRTGLRPTAAVPAPRRTARDAPPAYAPCLRCGQPVLTGETLHGHTLHLDVSSQCYVVTWGNKAPVPTLLPSRAYPVHRCDAGVVPGD